MSHASLGRVKVETRVANRRSRSLTPYAAALITAAVIFRIWTLSRSWFYFDDLAFMSAGMHDPLSWSFLGRVYAGHLMPAGWLVIKGLATWAPYNWGAWASTLVVMYAVAAVGMYRLLRSLFGNTGFVLALLAGYLFYIYAVPAGVWFAAGINQLPMQIALTFGLHAHVQYLRTRRTRSLVATLLWTVFGLLFYEKTLLLFGLYAIFALGWFATGDLTTRAKQLWKQYLPGILAHGVVAGAYGLIYLKYGLDVGTGHLDGSLLSQVVYRLAGQAFASGAVGGPFAWHPISANALADPSDLVCLGAWAALAALAHHAFKTRTMSRRAWWLIGFTTAANIYLLTTSRASIVGPDIGLEYRYQTEASAVFVLALGLAFLPLRGATEVNQLRPEADRTIERAPYVRLVTSLVVILSIVSTLGYVSNWHTRNLTPAFYRNVTTSVASAPQKPVPLVDAGIPIDLLWAFGYPENAYSHVFATISRQMSFPEWSVDHLYSFTGIGTIMPLRLNVARTMVPTPGCGYVLRKKPTTIRLTGPVIGGGWWIAMAYAAPQPFEAAVTMGDRTLQLTLPAGLHTVYYQAQGQYDAVTIANGSEGAHTCISSLTLGAPANQ